MEILGYFASVLIGVSLGLIGGGGSILAIPVLVYLFGVPAVEAKGYSFFIVGITTFIGVIPKYRQGFVNLRTAVIFGLPSIVAVYVTSKFIFPLIPKEIFRTGDFIFTNSIFQMTLFAILMLMASVSMIRNKKKEILVTAGTELPNYPLIILYSILIGTLTGLVGIGGGFLIIPALVLLTRLPMKIAIGTSLPIIFANSFIGFTGVLGMIPMDWKLLLTVSALAGAGILLGNFLSKKMDGGKLKKGFGWFILLMGIYIIVKELFFSH